MYPLAYLRKREKNSKSIALRVLATIGIVYISAWVIMFIPNVIYGSLFEGVWWSSGGPGMLFPVPLSPGFASVVTAANPFDSALYLIFLQSGIWIMWLLFFGVYAFSPYALERPTSAEEDRRAS